ncbi:flavonol sulfotransferase-like [Quercus suber]|uniref:Sulfotransferase n=1 Tax=Quercus suber TaxID=58331 RepID=A0AAW0KI28_QUESU
MPHECVLSLESDLAHNSFHRNLDTPLVGTHVPYTSLPKSIIDSRCKIIYICRDPKDAFVSLWHFLRKASHKGVEPSAREDAEFEEAFKLFCEIGDWKNHLTPMMAAHLDQIIEQKLRNSGLTLITPI